MAFAIAALCMFVVKNACFCYSGKGVLAHISNGEWFFLNYLLAAITHGIFASL
jgi:hypothetical protein